MRTYARCQVGNRGVKLKTGAKTEHGRQDQNTNARKLSERKGSAGTVQDDMKTGELATKKHGPSGKIERRSTLRVARQVWVQREAHSKRVAWKKPIPKNRKVTSRGVRVHAGCRKNEEDTQIRTRVLGTRPYARKGAGGVQWYVLRQRKTKTDERKTKRQHNQDAREEGEESTTDDQQLDRRGTLKLGVELQDKKHNFRARLACHVSAKMRGGRGQKRQKMP